MNKPSQQTANKMLQLVDLSTYQGRITYLAISFLARPARRLPRQRA